MQTPLSSTSSFATALDTGITDEKTVEANVESETLVGIQQQNSLDNDADVEDDADSVKELETVGSVEEAKTKKEDYVNTMGVRFTPVSESGLFFNSV